jgi:hypothetical protein
MLQLDWQGFYVFKWDTSNRKLVRPESKVHARCYDCVRLKGAEISTGESMTNRLWPLSRRSAPRTDGRSAPLLRPLVPLSSDLMEICSRELALNVLPNDLTRMLYLASLRDCNSGRYLHPQLSPRIGMEQADLALRCCHDQIFRRLLSTPASAYALQLEEYIRYTRAARSVVLDTWRSLQAYRSTVPLHALPIYSQLFCLNIELALTILNDSRAWLDQES